MRLTIRAVNFCASRPARRAPTTGCCRRAGPRAAAADNPRRRPLRPPEDPIDPHPPQPPPSSPPSDWTASTCRSPPPRTLRQFLVRLANAADEQTETRKNKNGKRKRETETSLNGRNSTVAFTYLVVEFAISHFGKRFQ